jgi:hypothetical protein
LDKPPAFGSQNQVFESCFLRGFSNHEWTGWTRIDLSRPSEATAEHPIRVYSRFYFTLFGCGYAGLRTSIRSVANRVVPDEALTKPKIQSFGG